jgi:hypothetical protein
MSVLRYATQVAAVCAFAGVLPLAAGAQGSSDATSRARFSQYDGNKSGWLSGRELDACGCRAYDRNGDSEITWAEFVAGEAGAPVSPQRAGTATVQGAAQQPAARATRTAYEVGQSVEVNDGGVWYGAMIVEVRDGRYALSRHDRRLGVTTDNGWVGPERLRPWVAPVRVAERSATTLPAAVPVGEYACTTYQTNQAIGRLQIYGGGISSGVTREALRPQYRFTYDPATGTMLWPAGLTIVGFAVESGEFSLQSDGTPTINLHYRRQAGGHLNSMYCQRN